MKSRLPLFALPVALAVVYIAGPSADLSYSLAPVDLPSDINHYIQQSEDRFSDIIEGAEKKIIWANPDSPGTTPFSIVYLHGFSASRQEIAPLCDELAKRFSANIFYTRLSGHGRSASAMQQVSVNALVNDANEALEIGKRLGKQVILVGTSTGASLASWLAGQKNDDAIAAMVLMSPNFGLKRKESELMLYPWGETILYLVQGDEYQFSSVNELHEKYWTTRYPARALLAMMGIVDVTRKINFANITTPTLILYSEQDKIVDTTKIRQRFQQLGSTNKQLLAVNNVTDPQQHVLAGDILSPSTTTPLANQIAEFLTPIVQP